jgi:uncharacterized protein
MVRLSYAISKVIVDEYGQHVFLKRLADPLWFQAFGCVLGFDWHSSGVTTVVTGVLKQSIKAGVHGISIAGGKGKKSTETKNEIPKVAEMNYNLSSAKIDSLLYASRMTAKVDSAAIQDNYSLDLLHNWDKQLYDYHFLISMSILCFRMKDYPTNQCFSGPLPVSR